MIGIIVAMKTERDAIAGMVENGRIENYRKQEYLIGTIKDKDVTVVEGGVGKVASAISCCRLIEHFNCGMVINIGTAGGLKEEQNVLDVVVADRLTYHDWDTESIDDVARSFANNEYVFFADERLVHLAQETMKRFDGHQTFVGPIVSGDCFVSGQKRVSLIKKHFPEAVACEMESTSIAHVCTMYEVPFVVIRSLSDIVTRDGNSMDFLEYVQQASHRAAVFTSEFLGII